MNSLDEIYALAGAKDLDSWFDRLISISKRLGYPEILFGIKPSITADNNSATILSTYSKEWREKYERWNYVEIDPTVRHSFNSSIPITWGEKLYSREQMEFFEEAKSYKMDCGISLPLHGPEGQKGMLSLKCSEASTKGTYKGLPEALMLRDFALETVLMHLNQGQPRSQLKLTSRELEVLKWSACGKTSWDISKILSCSEANVNFHFTNVRLKFKVSTRREAIVKAIRLGLI